MPDKIMVGWREFCALPTLNVPAIKAKIDTGARTSALHTSNIHEFTKDGQKWVKFIVHPIQNDVVTEVQCQAQVFDQRHIRNSGGDQELRYVIKAPINIADYQHIIELTLSSREEMKFRMLLGREALKKFAYVDSETSFCNGHYGRKALNALYKQ